MNTIYFILIFYYIFSVIVEESKVLHTIIHDIYASKAEKWFYSLTTTIIVIVIAPVFLPITIGKVLYKILNR